MFEQGPFANQQARLHVQGGRPSFFPASFLLLPGVLCIGLGVSILLLPQLLVAMVSTFFIFVGVVFLSVGYSARKMSRSAQSVVDAKVWEDVSSK